jgi:prepilin-type processing-associated H-X9-DG protein
MGLALHNYESSQGAFPPGGESTNFAVSPPSTWFADGNYSPLARVLSYIEGNAVYNAINFNYEYNHSSGGNVTAFTSVLNVFLCPSSVRQTGTAREGASAQSDTEANVFGGYAVADYGATVYTDIDPNGATGGPGSTPATPYRNKNARVNGALKQGMTRISEITDGTSNTMVIAEDAGRDATYQSPYVRGTAPANFTPAQNIWSPADQGLSLRFWRWAEADGSYGVSGAINNKFRPMACNGPWQPAGCSATVNGTSYVVQGNNAGANDEIFSYHPGGANILFADGSVKFLKETTSVVVLRKLVTPNGGEVISADQY